MLVREHVSTQDMLVREHVCMQDMLVREHVCMQSTWHVITFLACKARNLSDSLSFYAFRNI